MATTQTEKIANPYANLEEVFGNYVKFIEQQLKSEPPPPPRPIFEKEYTVKTLNHLEWDEKKAEKYEYGNRIVAPEKLLNILISKGALDGAIILQIFNKHIPEKISHCSVIEWTAPDDTIYVPRWMIFDFALQIAAKDAPKLTLRYYEKPFLKGSFIQIQPYQLKSVESEEFKDVKSLFEKSLRKYQCLTIGDTLRIAHNKNVHFFEVTDVLSAQSIAGVTPFNVVSLVNVDVAVDFLPAKDAPADRERENEDRDGGYDVNYDPKAVPNPDSISTTISSNQFVDEQAIDDYKAGGGGGGVGGFDEQKSVGNQLDDNSADKKKEVESFADIKGEKIVCDEKEEKTTIQMMLIGNKRERVQVNLTTTVKQLYAHARLLSCSCIV